MKRLNNLFRGSFTFGRDLILSSKFIKLMHLQHRERIIFGGLIYKRKPFSEEWWIPNKITVGLGLLLIKYIRQNDL